MLTGAFHLFPRRRSGFSHVAGRRRRILPTAAAERLEHRILPSAVVPFTTFQGVDWVSTGTGGIGGYVDADRNGVPEQTGEATLTINDTSGTVVAGYLYWQGIDVYTWGGNGTYEDNAAVWFGAAGGPATFVTGVDLGKDSTANWGDGASRAYRADVTQLLQAGTRDYLVSGLAARPGHEANGVSLVVVYQDGDRTNDRDLYVFNGNQVTGNSSNPWSVSVPGFVYKGGDVRVQLHVADGQSWDDPRISFSAQPASNYPVTIEDEPTLFDGRSVRSEGRSRADNGDLWDVHTFDVRAAFVNPFTGPGTYSPLLRQYGTVSDSLVLVAALFDTPSLAPANSAPAARDQLIRTSEDRRFDSGLLRGDDLEGEPLTYSVAPGGGPAHGTVTVAPDGRFMYTPRTNFFGTDRFRFVVSDGSQISNVATLTIHVSAVNDPPTFVSNGTSVFRGAAKVLTPSMLSASDVDNEPSQLVYTVTSLPSRGFVERHSGVTGAGWSSATTFTQADLNAGLIRYRHSGGAGSSDSFGFTISDGAGGFAGTFSIAVNNLPQVTAVTVGTGPTASRQVDLNALNVPVSAAFPSGRRTASWEVRTVSFTFDQDVLVDAGDLRVTGVSTALYNLTGFAYNAGTRTATWTLASAVANDRLRLALDADGLGDGNDGVKTADGSAYLGGEDIVRLFDVLYGDFDGNGLVNGSDLVGVAQRNGTSDLFADVDGSGTVNGTDLVQTAQRNGTALPAGNP